MALGRHPGEWTSRVIGALKRGLIIDPSIMAHRSRGEFLDRLRDGSATPGALLVPFPVAHMWAMARVDSRGVHAYLLSHQMQLPILDRGSYPPSLRAVAEWIRREPWIHGIGGRAALAEGLDRLSDSTWDLTALETGGDLTSADHLAVFLSRAADERSVPVLSFSDVYRSSLTAAKRTMIEAPASLASALFMDLGLTSSTVAARLAVPARVLGEPHPPVLGELLAGAQVLLTWPTRG